MRSSTILLFTAAILVKYSTGTATYSVNRPLHYQIAKHIFYGYNPGYIPKRVFDGAVNVSFSMELYQLIEINEPQQFMTMNAWTVERWVDKLLGWDPADFSNVTEIMVPFHQLWIPDTTLYNSLVMEDHQTRRLLSAKLKTRGAGKGALVELLYPTIYKQSCMLDLRFFPFDLQHCKLTFGSWTYDNTLIDYFPYDKNVAIGTSNCIDNEGWLIIATSVKRIVKKYSCCPNDYTLLEYNILVQRKPTYYVISLIIPTSIITFIAIIGFFSSPTVNDLRDEKITLGITTLLSMSILVFMVSDKIPSTSSFILIGWFYTSMILLISFGTLASSLVIFIQKKGLIGKFPSLQAMKYAQLVAKLVHMEMPLLMKQAYARKALEEKLKKEKEKAQQSNKRTKLWYKLIDAAKEQQKKEKANTEDKETISNGKPVTIQKYNEANGNASCAVTVDIPSAPKPKPFNRKEKEEARSSIDSSIEETNFNLRNLAQLEYDWLAAVVERIFLILFVVIFFLTSVGINFIGFYKWQTAGIENGFL